MHVLKVVRRRLALEVLVQPRAFTSGWAARLARGPAAASWRGCWWGRRNGGGRAHVQERLCDVQAAHRQAAEHNGVHLQRQSRGRAGAVGSVRDPERRRHRRHGRRVAQQRGARSGGVKLPAPFSRVAAEAGIDVCKVVRRRLVLEVLVQLGALVYDGAARRVRAPAAAGSAAGARRPEEKPQRWAQHWCLCVLPASLVPNPDESALDADSTPRLAAD